VIRAKASTALSSSSRRVWIPLSVVAAVCLLGSPSSVFAATKYLPVGQFPPPSENQLWNPANFSSLLAQSVAVSNKNGHVYVADSGRGVVYDYESAADREPGQWTGSNTPLGSFAQGCCENHLSVAADNTTGAVYVAERGHQLIDKFDEDGNLVASFGDTSPSHDGQLRGLATPAGSFSPPTYSFSSFPIAVNQTTHDLYVVDPGHKVIDVFDENGAYLSQITATPEGLYGEGGAYTTGIAVTAAGNVYIADFFAHKIFQFNSAGTLVSSWNGGVLPNGAASKTPEGSFGSGGAPLEVAAEDSTGHVFVNNWSFGTVDIFDASGNFLQPQITSAEFGFHFLDDIEGVTIDQATGELYASPNGGAVQVFKPVVVPDVSFNQVSGITATSATLSAHLDPAGGGDITACHFEYISNTDFQTNTSQNAQADPWTGTQQAPCTANPASSLPYSSPTDVSAALTALTPGTGFRYRIVVSNANGANTVIGQGFGTVGRHRFSTEYGSAGTGAGQLTNPQDVAVDHSSGDIYVADTGNHRIVKFSSSGNFLLAWGWGVSDGNAVAQVCTSACQAGIAGFGPAQFTSPTFVEVDNSAGPSAGDIYVADTADGVVQKFDASGHLIVSWGNGGEIDRSTDGTIGGISVDPFGDLFVISDNLPYYLAKFGHDGVLVVKTTTTISSSSGVILGSPDGTGIDFDSLGNIYEDANRAGVIVGNPSFQFEGIQNQFDIGLATGLAVDRSTNDLYVDHGTYIDQFRVSGPPSDFIGLGILHSAAGLAFNPSTGTLYAANAGNNDVAVFTPRSLPSVTTGPPANPGPTSATLTGHVDPNGAGNVTDCHFDYGTDATYSVGSVPCSPATPLASPVDVSADITGLSPFTTYHYRLVASGADDLGLLSYGADRSFTPTQGGAPGVDATSSSDLTPTTATLSAQINPNLAPTIYRFQYGTDTSYGSQTFPSDSIGNDGIDHAAGAAISGLQPGTTYHYRVLAVNFHGLTSGPDQTFNTPDLPAVATSTASNITPTAATLSAQIKPGFSLTTYRFQYGTTAAYGVESPNALLIADNSVHGVAATIAGLASGTTYHYRVLATNAVGSASGPDQTFTTTTSPPSLPPAGCKKGFVKRNGKCIKKKKRHKRRHQRRNHGHG
jgi:DNA-binding beta-propeller fold protein YncE